MLIAHALSGKPLPIYGDGQNVRDWLYVSDHCEAIRYVLEKGAVGETYNIGGKTEKTNLAVAEAVSQAPSISNNPGQMENPINHKSVSSQIASDMINAMPSIHKKLKRP